MPSSHRPNPPRGPRVRPTLLVALTLALLINACRDSGPPVDPETGRPIAEPRSPSAGPGPSQGPSRAAPADRDGDGLDDAEDRCPDEAEDRDAFEDDDGCPDLDNDRDGVLDVDDKCPNDPVAKGPNCQFKSGCPDDCRAPLQIAPS